MQAYREASCFHQTSELLAFATTGTGCLEYVSSQALDYTHQVVTAVGACRGCFVQAKLRVGEAGCAASHTVSLSGEKNDVMQMYLPFCGIAISNAQLFAASRKEYDRSRALLEVVNDLFEEQTDLEKIVKKIMHRAQTLLKCERCSVLLLEDIESPVVKFTKSFELLSPKCNADTDN
ncbi:PREDICTED: dual 3',5'-cyclic-AMP and -GMP phosphodiesterase 11A-like, partial [Merops nubicus]|uniref:dual 3',5'-cyclic-AMP and -GMP phosphodiesterase 11A-like n=1 Tax=Merops nubicus TaxID=57421 RepID=UPI0004F05497